MKLIKRILLVTGTRVLVESNETLKIQSDLATGITRYRNADNSKPSDEYLVQLVTLTQADVYLLQETNGGVVLIVFLDRSLGDTARKLFKCHAGRIRVIAVDDRLPTNYHTVFLSGLYFGRRDSLTRSCLEQLGLIPETPVPTASPDELDDNCFPNY